MGRILTLILLFFCLATIVKYAHAEDAQAYWLWAGLAKKDIPAASKIYLYQGNFKNGQFVHKGIFPSKLSNGKIILVFRFYGDFPETARVEAFYRFYKTQWERHGVEVIGLQIDFDSATAKLSQYAQYLKTVKKILPETTLLSVTGLGDWALNAAPQALNELDGAADEVVFQLYQGHEALPKTMIYAKALTKYPGDFKIGLLQKQPEKDIMRELSTVEHFRGIVYFVQK